jgi:hypothetical protein
MLKRTHVIDWFGKHRLSVAVALYCCVVAVLASATALISMDLPFTGFRHVVKGALQAFKI